MKVYQHLKADNDPNGNPQRLYLVYELRSAPLDEWRLTDVYDEGYHGRPSALRNVLELPSVNISKRDYHTRYARAKAAGLLRLGEA